MFMHQPREVHWTTALRILAYIKSSPEKGLLYKKHGNIRILGYSDSGYAGILAIAHSLEKIW